MDEETQDKGEETKKVKDVSEVTELHHKYKSAGMVSTELGIGKSRVLQILKERGEPP